MMAMLNQGLSGVQGKSDHCCKRNGLIFNLQVLLPTVKRICKELRWVCTRPHYCQLLCNVCCLMYFKRLVMVQLHQYVCKVYAPICVKPNLPSIRQVRICPQVRHLNQLTLLLNVIQIQILYHINLSIRSKLSQEFDHNYKFQCLGWEFDSQILTLPILGGVVLSICDSICKNPKQSRKPIFSVESITKIGIKTCFIRKLSDLIEGITGLW